MNSKNKTTVCIENDRSKAQQMAWSWLTLGASLLMLLTWINGRPEAAGLVQVPWDKAAHGLTFGSLALIFGLSAGIRRRWSVLLFMTAFAVFDELRQLYLPGRTASFADFSADMAAVIAALWLVLPWLMQRITVKK
jgi:VanZ family protein